MGINLPMPHHSSCVCDRCMSLVDSQQEIQKTDQIITPRDHIAIDSAETARRIIEIYKEQCGYSVSAINKIDGFTGEITFILDLKEAEEQMKLYKQEDDRCAIPPPGLQKKLDPIPYVSEDEGNTPGEDAILDECTTGRQYRITNTHFKSHIYDVEVVKLDTMEIVDSSIVDSPGTAELEFKRYVEMYQ
jgi:hypothetical protein